MNKLYVPLCLCLLLAFCTPASAQLDDISNMSDDEFIDMLIEDMCRYFIDHAHPDSGLITPDGNFTHVGSNGFGMMAMCIAAERGLLTRAEAAERVVKMQRTFLNDAAHFHGVFRWLTDAKHAWASYTGDRCSVFSSIETAYVIAGSLVCAEYFDAWLDQTEREIRRNAWRLYDRVEWDLFLQDKDGNETRQLAWEFLGDAGQFSSGRIGGYNECMVLYILACGSRRHPIPKECWEEGWGSTYKWRTVQGQDYFFCPSLFTHQYSHAWIDFRLWQDSFTREKDITYFENSRRAALSHIDYANANPNGRTGYGPIWGLTDCACPLTHGGQATGFGAHGVPHAEFPDYVDDGTIAVSAAGGCVPFVTNAAIDCLRYIYENHGDEMYDPDYGFYNAFNLSTTPPWFDQTHEPLNKGAMLVLLENYRSGLIWNLTRGSYYFGRGLVNAGFRRVRR